LLAVKILAGLLALALGLYLGGAGRYRPDHEEIDKALQSEGTSKRTKRHFTLLGGWLRQMEERGSHFHLRTRGAPNRRFNLYSPDSKRKKG
jgi:hypothetical protein